MASKLSVGLVGDGKVINCLLDELDRDWLESTLAGTDKKIDDIYFAEWNAEKGWHIQDHDGNLYVFDE